MAFDMDTALALVKTRKDMMSGITARDDYLTARIKGVCEKLAERGIHLTESTSDMMLVVDMTVWEYNNRDQSGPMPEWLKDQLKTRFMSDRRINAQAEVAADDP